jgi:4-amino-4-deoxy-L-arabinose transferase-like glycosyltransferase
MEMATTMLSSSVMNDGMGNVAYYCSGYPLFLLPFFAAFGASPQVAQAVNAALGVVAVVLVYFCGVEILPRRWALLAASIWTTYPPALVYPEHILKENLLIPLFLLQTFLLIRYPAVKRKALAAFAIGLVFGLTLLVGSAVLLTGAVLAAVIFCRPRHGWHPKNLDWGSTFACLLGCACSVLPWMSYTAKHLGRPTLATNGGFNLYIGNNPSATGYYVGIEDTPMGSQWHSIRSELGEIQSMSLLKQKAIEYMLDNPFTTATLSLKRIGYFWWPPVHGGESEQTSMEESLMRRVWLLYYLVIVGFAATVLVRLRHLGRGEIILLSSIGLYCAVYAVTYVGYRYQLPAMPMMSVLAACGMHRTYLWASTAADEIRDQ